MTVARLARIPAKLQVQLAAGGSVQDQDAGGSEDAESCSAQELRPPLAAGCRRRRLTTLLGVFQLKQKMGIFTQESGNTRHILPIWTHRLNAVTR